AYFDGPGGTQVPRAVTDAMTDYLLHHNSNSGWAYPSSLETDAAVAAGRQAMADFLNGSPDEIVFGQNMTTLTYHLARGLGRAWGKGDAVIITELDHHANQGPWRALEKERGIEVRVVRMDPATGQLEWDDLARLLTGNVKLLAIGAASNALGTVNDVAAAAAMAKATGALTFVDAVHYAPHLLVDVQAMGCDFLACSAYKFHGPHTGILWGKKALLEAVDVPKLDPAPSTAPDKLETGTQSFESIVGVGAAVDFLAGIGDGATRRERLASAYDAMHARQQALVEQMWEGLGSIRGVALHGPLPTEARTSTVSFTVEGHPSLEVAQVLADAAVFASNGDFYASTVVERLGYTAEGLVRAGAACYTTPEEVERLVSGVAAIASH
ncbi:MAG: cysteine desulfurase-like protein, partial [Gemmatimonadetes bacterium]|nr:cysteine desulfurase-like protein [Gemmatimonadota bacterium]